MDLRLKPQDIGRPTDAGLRGVELPVTQSGPVGQ